MEGTPRDFFIKKRRGGKSFWDWMDLLIVPIVLAIGAFLLSLSQEVRQNAIEETRIANQNIIEDRREEVQRTIEANRINNQATVEANRVLDGILEAYLDDMTSLMLNSTANIQFEKCSAAATGSALSTATPIVLAEDITTPSTFNVIARSRTQTVISQLSGLRLVTVLKFLSEAQLVGIALEGSNSLNGIDLSNISLNNLCLKELGLSNVNFSGSALWYANLQSAILTNANFSSAVVNNANLAGTILRNTNFENALLWNTDFEYAELIDANLRNADLANANLTNAFFTELTILPDGTNWTPATDMSRFTNPRHPQFWDICVEGNIKGNPRFLYCNYR